MLTLCAFTAPLRATRSRAFVPCALSAILLAGGCTQQAPPRAARNPSPTTASPWALPTSTMRWNEYACDLIARNQAGQFPAARILAYMNLAINNAIVAARQQGRKPDGAAAGAAATVLAFVFPKEEQAIAARLAGESAALAATNRADFTAGVEIGRKAAAEVIAAADEHGITMVLTGKRQFRH